MVLGVENERRGILGVLPVPFVVVSTASTRLAAWMEEIRNLFINSGNLLAWIQTIDGTETTTDHVILGYDPRAVIKDAQTKGPSVFIWPENFVADNRHSAKTYLDTFDIVSEIVWYKAHLTRDSFVAEVNFISDIIDEAKAKGITLSTVHLGEVHMIQSRDLILENPNNRDERRVEIRFSIRAGTNG